MLAVHKPKLIIFALDYWRFNEARVADPSPTSTSVDVNFSLKDLIAPYQWIFHGDADLRKLLKTILRPPEGGPLLGAWASQNGSGFDAHGAHHYGAILTGAQNHPDKKFKYTLKRLRKGKADNKVNASGQFSEAAWASLQHIAPTTSPRLSKCDSSCRRSQLRSCKRCTKAMALV
jgi:hypothetical protein